MPAEIIMFAEVNARGLWQKKGDIFLNPYYDKSFPISDINKEYIDRPYCGRSAAVNAILGNIDNGIDDHGNITSAGFHPISRIHRGYPQNISESTRRAFLKYRRKSDVFGISWYSYQELDEFNWKQKTQLIGYLPEEAYIKMKQSNTVPKTWMPYPINNSKFCTISELEMDDILAGNHIRKRDKKLIVKCKFPPMTYEECCPEFIDYALAALYELTLSGKRKRSVRVIFGFRR